MNSGEVIKPLFLNVGMPVDMKLTVRYYREAERKQAVSECTTKGVGYV